MGMEKPRNSHGYFLTPFRRLGDQRRFGHVMGHSDAHSAEHLNSLSDSVDKLVLPFIVLVEQQMQLVGWTNGFALFKIASASIKPLSSGLSSLSRAADRVALLHT